MLSVVLVDLPNDFVSDDTLGEPKTDYLLSSLLPEY